MQDVIGYRSKIMALLERKEAEKHMKVIYFFVKALTGA